MKKIFALVLVCVLTLSAYTALAEYETWRYVSEETGIIVEIGQNPENYADEYISIADGEDDLAVKVTIYGHPERSEELTKVLEYFGIQKYWSELNGKLNYLHILVSLGLDEGNL